MAKNLYDSTRFKKVYPLKRTKPKFREFIQTGGVGVETVILNYNNSFEETYFFTNPYTEIPTVAATPEDENVNVFITTLSTNSVTIQSSAPFTGKVHVQIYEVDN